MPRIRDVDTSASTYVSIRIDGEMNVHLRRQAKLKGTTLSAYVRSLVYAGAVAQNLDELEERLRAVVQDIDTEGRTPTLSKTALIAIFTAEEALRELLHQRDPQAWFKVSDKARRRADEEVNHGVQSAG